jgi:ubiquinone biosynthesis protein UbiJ
MSITEDVINRALEREGWAREKLAAHAGRSVRLRAGPIERTFAIGAEGRLSAAEGAPDLTLTISPLRLPALLAAPERWNELVGTEGDPALGATFGELALTLPWFVEQTLAGALGPIAGQQLADTGRRLLALPEHAARRFGDSFGRYVAGETRFAVGAVEARAFAAEIGALASRVDALAARIEALVSEAKR